MNKVLIFSHESDIDGLGCVILAKLAFKEIDYILAPNIEKMEEKFRQCILSKKLDDYSKIFVTDVALYDPALTMVAESELKDKVLIFDHHKMAIENKMNRYSFTRIIDKDIKGKRCGTDLFYEYLINNNYLKPTKALDQFVELTRLEDTWEWGKAGTTGQTAHDLAILFNSITIEEYIEKMLKIILNNNIFTLNDNDKFIIKNKKEEYEKNIQIILNNIEYFIDNEGNKFGIVYANYEYRNEISDYIVKTGNPEEIKYLIIVALDKGEYGQKSYRSIAKLFDVNKVAMKHGGGGHIGAAYVSITKEQKEHALVLSKKQGLEYLANSNYPTNK